MIGSNAHAVFNECEEDAHAGFSGIRPESAVVSSQKRAGEEYLRVHLFSVAMYHAYMDQIRIEISRRLVERVYVCKWK